jgi:nucleotidyltransferase/DNA polymerase involved in DNA repair
MPIEINYNDDRGRAHRQNAAHRLRLQRRRQQAQMARALQQQERPEVSFEEQVRRRFSSEIVKDLRPLSRLLSVIALILMTGRRSLLTESTLLMTGSTSRACAQLRGLIDPEYIWIDVMQPDFEKIDDPG